MLPFCDRLRRALLYNNKTKKHMFKQIDKKAIHNLQYREHSDSVVEGLT